MEALYRGLELPFYIFRVPNLKLKTPQIPDLAPMTVFYLVFLSYFLVASGVVYDIISDAPAMGQVTDEVTGAAKPVVFMKYRVNGQFIYEGLAAGMLFSLGGIGFIILDKSNNKGISERDRYVLLFAGGGAIVLAYNLLIVFLRIKIPGYQGLRRILCGNGTCFPTS
jgi:hypothetical protein